MTIKEPGEPDSGPSRQEIQDLLNYDGPDLRQQEQIEGVSLFDFRNTDENERNLSVLLSSQGIPFKIERPKLGWTGTQVRMLVTVPAEHAERTKALLNGAVEAGAIEKIEGNEGSFSR